MEPTFSPMARYQRIAAAAALVLCATGALHAQERWFERTFETGDGTVELVVADGTSTTVHIETGEPGRLVVEGTVTGFPARWDSRRVREKVEELATDPPVEHDGNAVRVGAFPWRVRRDLSFSYRFVVPPNTNVLAHGGMATHVKGLVGDLQVTGGRTFASEIQGDVTLERAEAVRVEDVTGDLHVTGGRIVASRISGDVVLTRAEQVELDAVRGNVTVTDRVTSIGLDDVLVDLGTLGH